MTVLTWTAGRQNTARGPPHPSPDGGSRHDRPSAWRADPSASPRPTRPSRPSTSPGRHMVFPSLRTSAAAAGTLAPPAFGLRHLRDRYDDRSAFCSLSVASGLVSALARAPRETARRPRSPPRARTGRWRTWWRGSQKHRPQHHMSPRPAQGRRERATSSSISAEPAGSMQRPVSSPVTACEPPFPTAFLSAAHGQLRNGAPMSQPSTSGGVGEQPRRGRRHRPPEAGVRDGPVRLRHRHRHVGGRNPRQVTAVAEAGRDCHQHHRATRPRLRREDRRQSRCPAGHGVT